MLNAEIVAIDSETTGLSLVRDRLCLVQLSVGDGNAHILKFENGEYNCPNLKKLLINQKVLKLFHFGRFDMAMFYKFLGVMPTPVFCTKIASKLVRTYTDRHGLKELVKELVQADLKKEQQSSDWASDNLSSEQLEYAANDVLFLHKIKAQLETMLRREGRMALAEGCFSYLPTRVLLDLGGWPETDVMAH